MLSCTRSDNKLQFYMSSRLICTSSDILLSDFNISLIPKEHATTSGMAGNVHENPVRAPQPVCIDQTINKNYRCTPGQQKKVSEQRKKKAVLSWRSPSAFMALATAGQWLNIK